MPYVNVPRSIGVVISSKFATLHELDTVYGLRDVHDFLEIITIDAENKRRMTKRRNR